MRDKLTLIALENNCLPHRLSVHAADPISLCISLCFCCSYRNFFFAKQCFLFWFRRCDITYILLEMDRLLRPEGTVIFRDTVEVLVKIQAITKRMKWKSHIADHESGPFNPEKILVAVKTYWTGGDAPEKNS